MNNLTPSESRKFNLLKKLSQQINRWFSIEEFVEFKRLMLQSIKTFKLVPDGNPNVYFLISEKPAKTGEIGTFHEWILGIQMNGTLPTTQQQIILDKIIKSLHEPESKYIESTEICLDLLDKANQRILFMESRHSANIAQVIEAHKSLYLYLPQQVIDKLRAFDRQLKNSIKASDTTSLVDTEKLSEDLAIYFTKKDMLANGTISDGEEVFFKNTDEERVLTIEASSIFSAYQDYFKSKIESATIRS